MEGSSAPRVALKILVIRFRALGDCVIAAWPVTALREAIPDAEITWAVEEGCQGVIDTGALVQRVEVFPRRRWKGRQLSLTTWREQMQTYLGLRKHKFDFGIDLHGHAKTALALRLSGARKRVAVQATDAFSARLNPVPILQDKNTHWVNHHVDVLRAAGFDVSVPARPILPARPKLEGLPDRPFVSICTGGSTEEKRYPADKWKRVSHAIRAAGFPVISLGGPDDAGLGEACDLDWAGRTSLVETMAVIERSALHIATDTGTGHFGAALGAPLVSLFGSREDHFHQLRPYTADVQLLRGEPDCRALDPEDVAKAALGRLGIL